MSAYAYTQMNEPVVVEHVQAHAGIDIGQTLNWHAFKACSRTNSYIR